MNIKISLHQNALTSNHLKISQNSSSLTVQESRASGRMNLISSLISLILASNVIGLQAGLFGQTYKKESCVQQAFDTEECTQCCSEFKLKVVETGNFIDQCLCDHRVKMKNSCLRKYKEDQCEICCREIGMLEMMTDNDDCICGYSGADYPRISNY